MEFISLFFLLGILLIIPLGMNYSRQKLSKCTTWTSEELERQNPDLRNIKWKYHLSSTGIALLLIGLYFFLLIRVIDPGYALHLAIPLLMFAPIYDSIFGLTTGVYPITKKFSRNRFVYDPDGKFRGTAYKQIAISIAISIVGLAFLLSF